MKQTKYKSVKWILYPNGERQKLADWQKGYCWKALNAKGKKQLMDELKEKAIVFDSEKEMERYEYLKHLEDIGEIKALKLQPKYVLQESRRIDPKVSVINYVADFEYMIKEDGKMRVVVEDVKGMPTQVAKLKRKMFIFKYPHYRLLWVCWANNSLQWMDYFENEKRKKANRDKKAKAKQQT